MLAHMDRHLYTCKTHYMEGICCVLRGCGDWKGFEFFLKSSLSRCFWRGCLLKNGVGSLLFSTFCVSQILPVWIVVRHKWWMIGQVLYIYDVKALTLVSKLCQFSIGMVSLELWKDLKYAKMRFLQQYLDLPVPAPFSLGLFCFSLSPGLSVCLSGFVNSEHWGNALTRLVFPCNIIHPLGSDFFLHACHSYIHAL